MRAMRRRSREHFGDDSAWDPTTCSPPSIYVPYAEAPDAFVTLGYLAARTTRVTLGVSVLVCRCVTQQ